MHSSRISGAVSRRPEAAVAIVWDISPPGSTSTRLLPGLGKVGPGCAPLPGATGRPLRRGKRAYEHAGVLCWRSVGLREPTAVPSVTERQER